MNYFTEKRKRLEAKIRKTKVQEKVYNWLILKEIRAYKAFKICDNEDYERILFSSEFDENEKQEFRKLLNL